jgi:hypothetical protein
MTAQTWSGMTIFRNGPFPAMSARPAASLLVVEASR